MSMCFLPETGTNALPSGGILGPLAQGHALVGLLDLGIVAVPVQGDATAHAVHDTSAGFALVEAGLGVALMNDIYARAGDANVAVVPLAPARTVEIGIAIRPGRPSPALAAFEAFAVPRLQQEAS